MNRVRVLFLANVDADNTNAQSLNVREIVTRLDPACFESTLFYERQPDPQLTSVSAIRLLQMPPRGRTLRIFREMLSGYDLIAYLDVSPASYMFLHLPRVIRGKTKTVYHEEAPYYQAADSPRIARFLQDGVVPRSDVCTAITDFIAQDLTTTIHRSASHILPVGVNTTVFTPPAARSNAVPVVLFAGTIIERKGPQHVIEAAARFPNAIFRLVGSDRGGFQQTLENHVRQLQLRNVTFEGARPQSEMIDIMRQSDVFLLPSRLEGIPKVTLEAASTGLPCIVFSDYQTPSVVHNVTGFQVSTLDEMMDAVGKLTSDQALRERMGKAAREHVAQFDWDLVARKWQTAYLEIAEGK
jgi:glycosyltransferase involved in cell wall biosynthesis